MKFKVGDKVRVREDNKEIDDIYEMNKLKGKEVTIGNIHLKEDEVCDTDYYNIYEDYGTYDWYEEYFEPVAENNAEVAENKDENTDEVSINSVESIDKFEKEDFKFGDIVTLRNGIQGLITIEEVQYNDDTFNHRNDFNNDLTHISNDKNLDIMRVQRYVNEVGFDTYQLKTLYYRKEEILTEKEKEYLSRFIKPFRNRIREISKMNYKNEEWLLFILNRENGIENFSLPSFDKNTIYKGMETNKAYTLEELGL